MPLPDSPSSARHTCQVAWSVKAGTDLSLTMARARVGALQAGAAQVQVTAVPVGRLVVVQEGGPGAGAGPDPPHPAPHSSSLPASNRPTLFIDRSLVIRLGCNAVFEFKLLKFLRLSVL